MPFSERLSSFSCSIDALLLNNLDTPQGPTDRGRATLHWSLQRLVAYLDVLVKQHNRSLQSPCQLEDSQASICIEEVNLLTFDIQLHFVANTYARARIKCGNTGFTARSEVDL